MWINPGEKIGSATLIAGLGYVALFRCQCGNTFTANRLRIDVAIYGDKKPGEPSTPPIPLTCGKCEDMLPQITIHDVHSRRQKTDKA
jgi:hypothetical protein